MDTLKNLLLGGCLLLVLTVIAPFILIHKACEQTPTPYAIRGVTPATVVMPESWYAFEANGAVRIVLADIPANPAYDAVYIPGLGETGIAAPDPGIVHYWRGRPVRITAISCTTSNWSAAVHDNNATNPCLAPVTDPDKQVSFTIWESR
jgi:hypothetical protein